MQTNVNNMLNTTEQQTHIAINWSPLESKADADTNTKN